MPFDVQQSAGNVVTLTARFYRRLNTKTMSDFFVNVVKTEDKEQLPLSLQKAGRDGRYECVILGKNLPVTDVYKVTYYGRWVTNSHGPQFSVSSYEVIPPVTKIGMIKYLSSSDFKKVGKQTAAAIVEKFGVKTLDVIANNPGKLLDVPGVTPAQARNLAAGYRATKERSNLTVLLGSYEISTKLINQISEDLGDTAVQQIRENPYILQNYQGIGFKTADKIARAMGSALDSDDRISGAAVTVMIQDTQEHCNIWTDAAQVKTKAMTLLNDGFRQPVVSSERYDEAIQNARRKKKLAACVHGKCMMTWQNYTDETNTAKRLSEMMARKISEKDINRLCSAVDAFANSPGAVISDEQVAAVKLCLSNPVSVLTGGPGTGKTTTVRVVDKVYQEVFPQRPVVRMAPTGKAARRMHESTGESTSTIHKRLRLHDENQKEVEELPEGLILIDESSMIDAPLMEKLMEAMPKEDGDYHVVFLGDINQLPSVGPGSVLKNLIDSKHVPVAELKTVHRIDPDAGLIADNAYAINAGNTNLQFGDKFRLIPAENEREAAVPLIKTYLQKVNQWGLPNVALLCPRRRASDRCHLTSDTLNIVLRDCINPVKPGLKVAKVGNMEFRVNDRVMQTKNRKDSSNGDIGVLTDIRTDSEAKLTFVIAWEGDDEVISQYSSDEMEDITLAYAMTIHKSQGSEYKCVIMPILPDQICPISTRNLLYTGLTRCKKEAIIVGSKKAVDWHICHADTSSRNTLLAYRIAAFCQACMHGSSEYPEKNTAHSVQGGIKKFIKKIVG